jgi:lipopolysaccharide transport system ATP-binding protein
MSSTVISVENLSKVYRLGEIGSSTLKDDFVRIGAWMRGKSAAAGGSSETHLHRREGNILWALRDVSFEVKRGEVLGIIGSNGAGKSTVLKILSRVTAPTGGTISIKGRVGSLLEVGTGFHPDLSGRENVFMNGAILGMTKAEIRSKFDEIVAFSEVEEFIDTPVKRYSSGMYVRLAFAVAAHLEPEILIIDEVLAVGDQKFQAKCIGKMDAVARTGRAVLLVSHNLMIVNSLCNRAILLEKGVVVSEGVPNKVAEQYIGNATVLSGEVAWKATDPVASNGRLYLEKARVLCRGKIAADVFIDEPVTVEFDFQVLVEKLNVVSSIHVLDKQQMCAFVSGTPSKLLERGCYRHSYVIPANLLNDDYYSIRIFLITDMERYEVVVHNAISFVVHEIKGREEFMGTVIGAVRPRLEVHESSLGGLGVVS